MNIDAIERSIRFLFKFTGGFDMMQAIDWRDGSWVHVENGV